jgi:formylglycine-generating enzyme required for sulfatase activity
MPALRIKTQSAQVDYFTELLTPRIALDMVLIPGGTFLMGSPEGEDDGLGRESPQHLVTVPTFFIGRYPITQAQWKAVANWKNKVNINIKPSPAYFKDKPEHPIEQVSWNEAQEFCHRLSKKTGRTYRLPTEAEWEYACRADTTTPFHCGETITTELSNYRGTDWEIDQETTLSGSYGRGAQGVFRETTTPVGSIGYPNAFGLSDMHGNIWEWCQDHWHDNYEGAPSDGSPWLSNDENDSRTLRGGSWDFDPWLCRSTCRLDDTSDNRYYAVGFRVVCETPRTL